MNSLIPTSPLEVSILMSILALPAAMIFLTVYICISEIKIRKQRKQFEHLVELCKEMHGAKFTSEVLGKCIEGRLPYESMIQIFQHHTKEALTTKTKIYKQKG